MGGGGLVSEFMWGIVGSSVIQTGKKNQNTKDTNNLLQAILMQATKSTNSRQQPAKLINLSIFI